MKWNYNIDEAPRGYTVEEIKTVKGKPFKVQVFNHQQVILASNDGETVTVSRWLPANKERDRGRWEMLATDETPLAWMPWPHHPHTVRAAQ